MPRGAKPIADSNSSESPLLCSHKQCDRAITQQQVWGAMTAAGDSVSLLTVQMQQTTTSTHRKAGDTRKLQNCTDSSSHMQRQTAQHRACKAARQVTHHLRRNKLTLPEQGHHNTALSLTHHRGIAAHRRTLHHLHRRLRRKNETSCDSILLYRKAESDMETAAKARSRGKSSTVKGKIYRRLCELE